MWVLVQNEVKMLRNYLLQIFGFVVLAIAVFSRTAPHFVTSYFTVFPIVMGLTLPQVSFAQEERGKTFGFLRSLPIKPKDIVGAKYVVAYLVTLVFWIAILAARVLLPTLNLTYAQAAFIIIAAAGLSGMSFFQHFALGLKSAKIALLVSFFGISALAMLLSQSIWVQEWLSRETAQQLYTMINTFSGSLISLFIGALLMFLSYKLSALVFTRRDISRLP